MKKFIIAVLVAFTINNSLVANPVILSELQKMEAAAAATKRQLAEKDSQLAAMAAEIAAKDSQLTKKDQEITALKESPDFDQAVKVKLNQTILDAKTSITKITEEIISKLKGGK